jgi:hypothetical protein
MIPIILSKSYMIFIGMGVIFRVPLVAKLFIQAFLFFSYVFCYYNIFECAKVNKYFCILLFPSPNDEIVLTLLVVVTVQARLCLQEDQKRQED